MTLCATAIAASTLALLAAQKQSVVTVANHQDRIKKGMHLKDVECIFGVQGTDFPWVGVRSLAWRTDDGALVAINFDEEFCIRYVFVYAPEETRLQKLFRLFTQPWQ